MPDGYVKLHRALLKWEWWDDQNTTRLWITLLLLASFRQTRWHGQTILPGQIITSLSSLGKSSGLSVQSVRTSLSRLKSTGEITCESTSRFTVVTIAKWDKFQVDDDEPASGKTNETTINQQASNKQVTSVQQHRKNVKNVKNIFTHESEAYRCAKYLANSIEENLPEEKISEETMQRWAEDFDKVHRLDKKTWPLIADVLAFAKEDQFWNSRILSGKKFREKFTTLYAQAVKT
ncbi:hypothetical protein SAMN02745823_03835 [Sporobacter termitidis DSM 10068]|uniref:Transcription factor AP-2 C-terminal domain-containing protein n=1 Tax=Sporobacter termitidis DSM 10068 TaxID=1123282 RepID=A0A1M5ZHR8_9FIRM|nr:hypothetical protein [Sporobacter termitidis]SHI23741.1 hypothetical protein SAMN02745823_03757 [Sporobacter termitidis DSM 10068]SHI24433.1 hypothetical protein SAMN02745823_03835 [Sporobacter termitidis DSM 10068]